MSEKFKQKWEGQSKGLRKVVNQTTPLKLQLNRVLACLESQNERLDSYISKYDYRDKEIFEKIVQAQQRHDNAHAKILADELSEVRRQKNVFMHSKLALENVCLRLRTVYEFGNTASSVSGLVKTIKSVRNGIAGILPDIGNEILKVENMLGDMVTDIGGTIDSSYEFTPTSEDANRILKEAAIVVENRMKEKLPSLSTPQESYYVNGSSTENAQM